MSSLGAVMKAESELLLPTYDRNKVLFRSGRGCYLFDDWFMQEAACILLGSEKGFNSLA